MEGGGLAVRILVANISSVLNLGVATRRVSTRRWPRRGRRICCAEDDTSDLQRGEVCRYALAVRHSVTWLLARLKELDALMESGAVEDMTDAEHAELGQEVRDVVPELLDLEAVPSRQVEHRGPGVDGDVDGLR